MEKLMKVLNVLFMVSAIIFVFLIILAANFALWTDNRPETIIKMALSSFTAVIGIGALYVFLLIFYKY